LKLFFISHIFLLRGADKLLRAFLSCSHKVNFLYKEAKDFYCRQEKIVV
jgi:hypothetical protein